MTAQNEALGKMKQMSNKGSPAGASVGLQFSKREPMRSLATWTCVNQDVSLDQAAYSAVQVYTFSVELMNEVDGYLYR